MDQSTQVPQPLLNPPVWEVGHIAWVAEWYICVQPAPATRRTQIIACSAAAIAGSMPTACRTRSATDLICLRPVHVKTYCHEVLDRVLDKLSREPDEALALYPYRLALAHEDRHGEALLAALQVLGLAAPELATQVRQLAYAPTEIAFPGGSIDIGSARGAAFAFDNELQAHTAGWRRSAWTARWSATPSLPISSTDGGYDQRQFWSRPVPTG
jgi:hypothetical protein